MIKKPEYHGNKVTESVGENEFKSNVMIAIIVRHCIDNRGESWRPLSSHNL